MFARCTRRTNDWTTSDIGGRNSGSACSGFRDKPQQCGKYLEAQQNSEHGYGMYLHAKCDSVGEAGQGFRGVQTLERWIDHLV
jgi:hypothetical protein